MLGLTQSEEKQFDPLAPLKSFAKPLDTLGSEWKVLTGYAILAALFLAFANLGMHPIILVGRAFFGVLALLVMPGAIVTAASFSKRYLNIGTSLLVGLLLLVVEVQLMFFVQLFLGLQIPIIYWIMALNLIAISVSYYMSRSEFGEMKQAISVYGNGFMYAALLAALFLRLLLFILAQDCMAPDAALYADYGRSISEGQFQSSILNDNSVTSISNGVQIITHQTFSYVSAISWMIFPALVAGPSFILTIIGTATIIPIFQIAKSVFGMNSARFCVMILIGHPLFVFHSSVGYGPEIVTLFISLFIILVLLDDKQSSSAICLVGVLLGLVESMWDPNFYILCFTIPILLVGLERQSLVQGVAFFLMMMGLLLSRLMYGNIPFFIIVWGVILFTQLLLPRINMLANLSRFSLIFPGVLIAMIFWRSPWMAALGTVPVEAAQADLLTFITAVINPFSVDLAIRFSVFLIFHVTPILFVILLFGALKSLRRKVTFAFVTAALIAALGTARVFGLISGSLQPPYIYSDSRFFLFIVALIALAIAGVLNEIAIWPSLLESVSKPNLRLRANPKLLAPMLIIMIGFIPGYLAVPTGINLVDTDSRYGWLNLRESLAEVGHADSRFLSDRAREFSWFTARDSAVLRLSERELVSAIATQEILQHHVEHQTEFVLIDGYTIAKWRTLEFLLENPLHLGAIVALNASKLIESLPGGIAETESLLLVAETPLNEYGRNSRIFEFIDYTHVMSTSLSLLDDGWVTTLGAEISNITGHARLVIGDSYENATSQRSELSELGLNFESGMLILEIAENGAVISSMEVLDSEGNHYECESFEGAYICYLGSMQIDDIQITISGEPGSFIEIRTISFWEPI